MTRSEKEEEITRFWEDNRLFEKSVQARPKSRQYVFYDGPPFATGLPHYGHILGSTSKDVFGRYWTMKGFRVERTWGWDCHGLPIENIVEKMLGIKEKKEIENVVGIEKFNETCRSQVLNFAHEWKKTVRRMGRWVDIDGAYKTMDDSYMESVWSIFKRLHSEGKIYEGKKILLYCPRCETPLANSEIAMDNSYRDVTETTMVAKFAVKGEPGTFILAWTTTPWTLIGNVALALNPKLAYVKARQGGELLILAKERLCELGKEGDYEVVEEFPGSRILGLEYEPLYAIPSDKKGHYVIDGGDEVSSTDGTGIVHMAVYGEFDYKMIRKYDLPVIQHLDMQGKLVKGPEAWHGFFFKKADRFVIEDLDARGLKLKEEKHTHSYPFCYRCETPLFYNAVDSWFVDIQKVKGALLEQNESINWYPGHIKHGRFQGILETAPDWSISRNRFWATAIPVWKCAGCGAIEVIGSVEELRGKAVGEVPEKLDLHKHVVDKIALRCPSCGKGMRRIPEVIDCWFESASMPYAAKHWPFENKEWFETNYPADFVAEYIAQVRAWFYYMHVMGVLLFGKPPFKHVLVTGNMLAEDGSKMSKSKNNFPDPNLMFTKYGADAMRLYLMSSTLMKAQDTCFSEESIKEAHRTVVLLENVANFYALFGKGNTEADKPGTRNVLDRWVVSKLALLSRDVSADLDAYDTVNACVRISDFIGELSTWYVRRSRARFKGADEADRGDAVRTLAFALHAVSRISAPMIPFIAEEVHLLLKSTGASVSESVHLEDWPALDASLIDEGLNARMQKTKDVVSIALLKREEAKLPVRQALAGLRIGGVDLPPELLEVVKDELNVKSVSLFKSEAVAVELDTSLTPELVREGIARDLIRKINGYRKELKLTIEDRITLGVSSEDATVLAAVEEFEGEISGAVQADRIVLSIPEGAGAKELSLGGAQVRVSVQRIAK